MADVHRLRLLLTGIEEETLRRLDEAQLHIENLNQRIETLVQEVEKVAVGRDREMKLREDLQARMIVIMDGLDYWRKLAEASAAKSAELEQANAVLTKRLMIINEAVKTDGS